MSKNAIILCAMLAGVALVVLWTRSGEETVPTPVKPVAMNRPPSASAPSFPERRPPRSLFDRSNSGGSSAQPAQPEQPEQHEADREGGIVMKNHIEQRPESLARRPPGRNRREARLDPNRSGEFQRGYNTGMAPRGQLSRRELGSEDVGNSEQPPSRAPAAAGDDDEDDFDQLRNVALSDPDPDERADVLSQLDLDDPAQMQVLIQALNDHDPEVRLAALEELSTGVDDPPVAVLGGIINDPDPEVRVEVVRMLADSQDPYAKQLLRAALSDTSEDVRDEAAEALDQD